VASRSEGCLVWDSLASSRRELLGSWHGPLYGTMLSRLVLRGGVLSPDVSSGCFRLGEEWGTWRVGARVAWDSLASSRRELLGSWHGPLYGTMLSRLVLRGAVLSPDAGPPSSCSSSSLGRACSCSVGGGILTRPRGAVPAAQVFVKVLGRGLTVLSCEMGCRCMCADANGKDGGRRLALSKWG